MPPRYDGGRRPAPGSKGIDQNPPATPGLVACNPAKQHHYQAIQARERAAWPLAAAGWTFHGARGHLVTLTDAGEPVDRRSRGRACGG